MGFCQFGKFYCTLGMSRQLPLIYLFNAVAWDGLAPDLQATVEQCAATANMYALSESTAYSAPQLQKHVNEHGSIVKSIPDDALTALRNIIGEIISNQAASDPISKKVLNSLLPFRAVQIEYSHTTKAEFMRARSLPYNVSEFRIANKLQRISAPLAAPQSAKAPIFVWMIFVESPIIDCRATGYDLKTDAFLIGRQVINLLTV